MKIEISNKTDVIKIIIFTIVYKITLDALSMIISYISIEKNISFQFNLIIYYSIVTIGIFTLHYIDNRHQISSMIEIDKLKLFLIVILITIFLKIIFTVINYSDVIFGESKLIKLDNKEQISMLNLIITSIIIPIYEELFFRGILLKKLIKKNNIWLSVFIVSLLFTLAHSNNIIYGIFGLKQLVIVFMASVLFSIIYVKTRKITYSIVSHIIFNISNDIIFGRAYFNNFLKDIDFNYLYWLLIISVTFGLYFLLKKLLSIKTYINN